MTIFFNFVRLPIISLLFVRHQRYRYIYSIITRTCGIRYWQSLTAPKRPQLPRMFSKRENIAENCVLES